VSKVVFGTFFSEVRIRSHNPGTTRGPRQNVEFTRFLYFIVDNKFMGGFIQ